MNNLNLKDIVILGLMNFALFVGAGNIIFPPFIGIQAGSEVWTAAAGFLLTGVGLPVIASIAIARANGNLETLTNSIGKRFGLILIIICYLCIGPFGATPRTASVSYELAVKPFLHSDHWLWLYSVIYFAIVISISLRPNELLKIVGKILSPLKIIALVILAVTAISLPTSVLPLPYGEYAIAPFSAGVTNGYLTMDTLAALVFGLVIVNAIKSKNITSNSKIVTYAIISGLIAGLGLCAVYLSLFKLGLSSASLINNATNGAEVLRVFVHYSYGTLGNAFLGILITVACLVTAIGLCCALASFFSTITKFSYPKLVYFFGFLSMLITNIGLTQLIKISEPVLTIIHPVFIILILTSFFFKPESKNIPLILPTVLIAMLFGVFDAFDGLNLLSSTVIYYLHFLPLQSIGFEWALPCLLTFTLSIITRKAKIF